MENNFELMLLLRQRRKIKEKDIKKRRFWVHPILKERLFKGDFFQLIPKLKSDEERFYTYFRMNINSYKNLIEILSNGQEDKVCHFRKDILSLEHKIAITLR